ncbi:MAG: hypothetical protein HC846_11240 [Blastocatellia bacterium]|nr:hypothetical protein [Blastocatellia bacterium]
MAGGTSDGAQTDKVLISRQVVGSMKKTEILVNLKEIKKKNDGDVMLQANDIIEVPGPSGGKKLLRDIFRTIIPSVTRFPVPIP